MSEYLLRVIIKADQPIISYSLLKNILMCALVGPEMSMTFEINFAMDFQTTLEY